MHVDPNFKPGVNGLWCIVRTSSFVSDQLQKINILNQIWNCVISFSTLDFQIMCELGNNIKVKKKKFPLLAGALFLEVVAIKKHGDT